jgi:hypothetical protein
LVDNAAEVYCTNFARSPDCENHFGCLLCALFRSPSRCIKNGIAEGTGLVALLIHLNDALPLAKCEFPVSPITERHFQRRRECKNQEACSPSLCGSLKLAVVRLIKRIRYNQKVPVGFGDLGFDALHGELDPCAKGGIIRSVVIIAIDEYGIRQKFGQGQAD